MGKPGWDDDTWTPSRSSRGSRADNDARYPGRSDRRSARGEDAGGDRQRSSGRGDDWRGSSGMRPGTGRDYQDPRGAGRDPRRYGAGGYDPRGPRPPARNRPPAGGGVWTDGTGVRPNRPRPGPGLATDARGSSMAGRQSLEALRANRLRQQGIDPEDEGGGFTVGMAFMVILLMLVLGAGSAYVYFRVSTPAVHINSGTPSTTPTIGGASPTVSPTRPSGTATP